MDQKIPVGITLMLNIALLAGFGLLLLFLLYRILRKGEHRTSRILICAFVVLLFSETYSKAIILPLKSAVFNIEFFVSLDRDAVSEKDATGKWEPITDVIQSYPISELLVSIVIGIILFQVTAILSCKKWIPGPQNVNI